MLSEVSLTDLFWKSRFLPDHEFQHIFEAKRYFSSDTHRGQWRAIYDWMRPLKSTPAVLNRKRIWDLSTTLVKAMKKIQGISCDGQPVQSFFEPHAPPADDPTRNWVTASRALKLPKEMVMTGSRVLYLRQLGLPSRGLCAFYISTVELFGRSYICGLRIVGFDGNASSLGYRHADNETCLLSRETGSLFQLAGFCLAQDQRGVRGIALISMNGALSDWCGDYHDIPKRRLALPRGHGAPDSLQGGFDVS